MREVEFKNWMASIDIDHKVQSDIISRIKRIERELDHMDIDEEYQKDKCVELMSIFKKLGKNEKMAKYTNCSLPIGKYSMPTYSHAIRKYIAFRDSVK